MSDTCAIPATESDTRPRWPVRRVTDYKRLAAKTNSNGMNERDATLSVVRSGQKCKLVSLQFRPAQNQHIRIRSRRRYWPLCRRHRFTSVCSVCLSRSVRLSSGFYRGGGGRPSKQETLTQCWANVGPPSTMLSHC